MNHNAKLEQINNFDYRYDQGFNVDYVYAHQIVDWIKVNIPEDHQKDAIEIASKLMNITNPGKEPIGSVNKIEKIIDGPPPNKRKHKYDLRSQYHRYYGDEKRETRY